MSSRISQIHIGVCTLGTCKYNYVHSFLKFEVVKGFTGNIFQREINISCPSLGYSALGASASTVQYERNTTLQRPPPPALTPPRYALMPRP